MGSSDQGAATSIEETPSSSILPLPLLLAVCFVSVIAATAVVALLPSASNFNVDAKTNKKKCKQSPGPSLIPPVSPPSTDPNASWQSVLLSSRMNLRRKFQHITSGLLIFFLYIRVTTWLQAVCLLLFSSLVLYIGHRLRLKNRKIQAALLRAFGSLLRPHEEYSLPGAFYLLLGCGMCILAFGSPHHDAESLCAARVDIPAICLLLTSIADPLAGFFGVLIGEWDTKRINGKSRIASMLSAALCAVLVWVYLSLDAPQYLAPTCSQDRDASQLHEEHGYGIECPWFRITTLLQSCLWSLLASSAAAIFELWDPLASIRPIDDNFRIPVGTGLTLFVATQIGVLFSSLAMPSGCRPGAFEEYFLNIGDKTL